MGDTVLLVDGGARGDAIARALLRSPRVDKILVAPGNGGTGRIPKAQQVSVSANDIEGLIRIAKDNRVDMTIFGPEDPLINGGADAMAKEGIRVFGPNAKCAQIEGKKDFARELMKAAGVPGPKFEIFTSYEDAVAWLQLQEENMPWVVKAPGPALGKGALICKDRQEAVIAVGRILVKKEFKEAGYAVVIEEYLKGYEVSLIAICSGMDVWPLLPSMDHKYAGNGNTGPMTGGMGCLCPHPTFPGTLGELAIETVFRPILRELGDYNGVLYAGCMVTTKGIKVLECNCRFGDPETPAILPLLLTDLYDLMEAAIGGRLNEVKPSWSTKRATTVVLATPGYGYSNDLPKGMVITLPKIIPKNVVINHAGTKIRPEDNALVANGGRVLDVTAVADNFSQATDTAYIVAGQIHMEGGFQLRDDIGR